MTATERRSDEATKGTERHGPVAPSSLRRCVASSLPARSGFSFTEVLFAVIILGIGFIMVAAIFPVAIQQAKNTSEEVTAATIARGAIQSLNGVFRDGQGTVTLGAGNSATNTSNCNLPTVQSGSNPAIVQQPRHDYPTATGAATPLWKAIAGNTILSEDPRFAWTMLFRREGDANQTNTWASAAQVYVFCLQVRNKTEFNPVLDTMVLTSGTITYSANIQPRPVKVAVLNDVAALGGVDLLAFDVRNAVPAVQRFNVGAAIEGAYVIIAKDNITTSGNVGRMNGRIYRLGARRSELDSSTTLFPSPLNTAGVKVVYELQPGNDFTPDPGADGILAASGAGAADDIEAIGISNPAGTNSTVTVSDTAEAFVVGRGYINPQNPPEGFEGPSMAVGVYTTFIGIKTN